MHNISTFVAVLLEECSRAPIRGPEFLPCAPFAARVDGGSAVNAHAFVLTSHGNDVRGLSALPPSLCTVIEFEVSVPCCVFLRSIVKFGVNRGGEGKDRNKDH